MAGTRRERTDNNRLILRPSGGERGQKTISFLFFSCSFLHLLYMGRSVVWVRGGGGGVSSHLGNWSNFP